MVFEAPDVGRVNSVQCIRLDPTVFALLLGQDQKWPANMESHTAGRWVFSKLEQQMHAMCCQSVCDCSKCVH